jgi:hypothetical protein
MHVLRDADRPAALVPPSAAGDVLRDPSTIRVPSTRSIRCAAAASLDPREVAREGSRDRYVRPRSPAISRPFGDHPRPPVSAPPGLRAGSPCRSLWIAAAAIAIAAVAAVGILPRPFPHTAPARVPPADSARNRHPALFAPNGRFSTRPPGKETRCVRTGASRIHGIDRASTRRAVPSDTAGWVASPGARGSLPTFGQRSGTLAWWPSLRKAAPDSGQRRLGGRRREWPIPGRRSRPGRGSRPRDSRRGSYSARSSDLGSHLVRQDLT